MTIQIVQVSADALARWADVPIRFRVETVFEVSERDRGLGGLALVERSVEKPYTKDYDAEPANRPARWPDRFDVSHWGLFQAVDGDTIVGCAAVAARSPGVDCLAATPVSRMYGTSACGPSGGAKA